MEKKWADALLRGTERAENRMKKLITWTMLIITAICCVIPMAAAEKGGTRHTGLA